jgi:hypothetical protein
MILVREEEAKGETRCCAKTIHRCVAARVARGAGCGAMRCGHTEARGLGARDRD